MKIDVVHPTELTADDISQWRGIQTSDLAMESPFLSPQWVQAVEKAQRRSRYDFRVAIIREDIRPVAFLPVRAGRLTALPIGAPFCDYQAVICEPDYRFDPYALIKALGVQRYDFTANLTSQKDMAKFGKEYADFHLVDLPDGYAAYEANRRAEGAKIFKQLGTSRRNAEKNFGALKFTARATTPDALDRIIALKSAQLRETGKSNIFNTWSKALLHDLFENASDDFGAYLFTLHLNEDLAAAHLHLRNGRVLTGWLIAHEDRFQSVSPGIILFHEILKWMETDGLTRLDLGIGDYQFKRAFSTSMQRAIAGSVGLPSPVTWMRQAAYGASALAKALPLGKFSDYPARARRRLDVIRSLN